MGTLYQDVEAKAKEAKEAFDTGRFIRGIRILLAMKGEVAAYVIAIIATFKVVTFASVVFPPAAFGHAGVMHLCSRLMHAVVTRYPSLPSNDRQDVSFTLAAITNAPGIIVHSMKKIGWKVLN
jgi:hypothetical protein